MAKIKVLLADDHALVRAGIASILKSVQEVEVIVEASDGHETLQLVQRHQPDLVLLDITMQGLNGIEVLAQITKRHPDVRVLMLSMHANEEYVIRALKYGAAGYILKSSSPSELKLAIDTVLAGGQYLSAQISKKAIEDYLRRVGDEDETLQDEKRTIEQLTARQLQVLQLIAEGHSTKEAAARLNLSVKTVESHRTQLMSRLDIHDIAGLVRYAIRTGLISPNI